MDFNSTKYRVKAPGRVIRMRLHPQDCLRIIDLLSFLKVPTSNKSFDQITRECLSIMLEHFEQAGKIPTRNGFEYAQMMEPFEYRTPQDIARRLSTTRSLDYETVLRGAADMPRNTPEIPQEAPVQTFDEKWAHRVMLAIIQKKEVDPLNCGPREDAIEQAVLAVIAGKRTREDVKKEFGDL